MRILLGILIVSASLLGSGCARTVAVQGYHDVWAWWSSPSLEAKLPAGYRASDVASASDVALRRMGYTITERRETDGRSLLTARPPGSGVWDRVVVQAKPAGRRIRVIVTTRPLGDEDRARLVLDEMLVLLGL